MLRNIVVLVLFTGSLNSLKGQLFKKAYLYADLYRYINPLTFTLYPKIGFPYGRAYGMSFGPEFLVIRQAISVELVWSHMIGIVRPKKY